MAAAGAWLLKARRIRNAIRLCASTVLLVRALVLLRDRPAFPGVIATRDVSQRLLRRAGSGDGLLDGADADRGEELRRVERVVPFGDHDRGDGDA